MVAAGNEGSRNGVAAPGCLSSAVTVGATDDSDLITAFSNRGPLLDLVAPGVDIDSSVPDDTYGGMSGTSMSTPHVAGGFALMRQAFPDLGAVQILQRLQATVRQIVYSSYEGQIMTTRIDLGAATSTDPKA